ncbi:transcription factor WhiB (plasmid) [Pseudonocardia dioxanivorans CB1190]|uniref:Transcription factor WhiB n=1 Tax=Pseudonocardia dioxanivorans (strain ATCC 55486 / DSM 44775 / JCM 13855 / CB1190) TaxID=675635 RepID=F2L6K9_PSEUX|nr:transcription factor WhiB [Pseudonocardia dioxanivorans CB1190]
MDFRDHDLPCRAEDPELFFPVGTGGPAARQIEEAKAVCRRCPVTAACLSRAFELGAGGVWGATTQAERRRAKRHGPGRSAAGPSPQQERRAAAVACVRQGARRVAVAAQYGISSRTLDRWLVASA